MRGEKRAEGLQSLGSQGTEYELERVCPEVLETFESPNTKQPPTVHISFPEFTSLCPKTKQPDFATIEVNYQPRELCVESKSLKLYFFSYRQTGCFMEEITDTITEDLFKLLNPHWIEVIGKFNPRGAMILHPRCERGTKI